MENVGNYRNCATFIKLSILVTMKSGILLSGRSSLRLGHSPFTLHRWKWSLVWIQGRNMGLVSRILKVWHICMLEWTCKVVHYVGEAGKRWILMGYYFSGVIVARFSYIPCVWLYVQQLLFFRFLSEICYNRFPWIQGGGPKEPDLAQLLGWALSHQVSDSLMDRFTGVLMMRF